MYVNEILKFVQDNLTIILLSLIILLILIKYWLRFRFFLFGKKIHIILVNKDNNEQIVTNGNFKINYAGIEKDYSAKKISNENGVKFYIPSNNIINLIVTNTDEKRIVAEVEISSEEKREHRIPITVVKIKDQFDLKNFLNIQKFDYQSVLCKLENGCIKLNDNEIPILFPQPFFKESKDIKFPSIKCLKMAEAYIKHEVLGERLKNSINILLSKKEKIDQIFSEKGKNMLHACLTIFYLTKKDKSSIFYKALNEIFEKKLHDETKNLYTES